LGIGDWGWDGDGGKVNDDYEDDAETTTMTHDDN